MNLYQETLKTCAEILKSDFNITESTIKEYSPKTDDIHACRFFFSESNAFQKYGNPEEHPSRDFSDYLSQKILLTNPELTELIKTEMKIDSDQQVKDYIKDTLMCGEGILIYL